MMEEKKEGKELLLFQIGPVQEFIAQAAEPGDLWAGSYLLSSLILAGAKKVPGWDKAERVNGNFVFPDFTNTVVIDAMAGEERIPTIPNRFLAWVDAGTGPRVAEAVKGAIKEELDGLIAEFVPYSGAKEQSDNFLSMTWAVLPASEVKDKMGENYSVIGRKLALRRNLREFEAWVENPVLDGARKDYLSGKEAALLDAPGDAKSESQYRRGAMNLLKLKMAKKYGKNTAGILEKGGKGNEKGMKKARYIAVLAMDGDKMGATLSGLECQRDHRDFSSRLAEFSRSVRDMMPDGCRLIYAGGDDVLAVVPAIEALSIAKKLAAGFEEKMKGVTWKDGNGNVKPVTASVGIAIGSMKMPLQDLVREAHAAEHRAKTNYGRGAFAMGVFKRSGEILQWGGKWGGKGLELYETLHEVFGAGSDEVTKGFPHKLAGFLSLYGLDRWNPENGISSSELRNVIIAEVKHVCERSTVGDKVAFASGAYADEVFSAECAKPQDFMAAFLCEDFIDRPREEDR